MTKKRTPRLDALLDRVESICKNKSALAREIGVSPQHVHMWITAREYEPGGEVTLHLLEWVTAEAGKQKQKGRLSASAPRRPKARSTQSSYEKRKTGPPRK